MVAGLKDLSAKLRHGLQRRDARAGEQRPGGGVSDDVCIPCGCKRYACSPDARADRHAAARRVLAPPGARARGGGTAEFAVAAGVEEAVADRRVGRRLRLRSSSTLTPSRRCSARARPSRRVRSAPPKLDAAGARSRRSPSVQWRSAARASARTGDAQRPAPRRAAAPAAAPRARAASCRRGRRRRRSAVVRAPRRGGCASTSTCSKRGSPSAAFEHGPRVVDAEHGFARRR